MFHLCAKSGRGKNRDSKVKFCINKAPAELHKKIGQRGRKETKMDRNREQKKESRRD